MALKQDERALLQLVCERGQTYADLAELLGISERQVREKARGALAELGGSDPDAEVPLTDYLLGQADPIGRADAVRFLQQDAETRELAETIVTKLGVIAPAAQLPKLPEPKGRRRRATAAPAAPEAGSEPVDEAAPAAEGTGGRAPGSRQSRMLAALAAVGLILVFVILAVAGVFSGGGTDSSQGSVAEQQRSITPVKLSAQNGSGVAGRADFGLANDQLFVDLTLDGLDPKLDKKSVYVLWLMLSEGGGYPVSIIVPSKNGSVQDRYAVPTPVAVAIASNARFVEVSQSPSRELRGQINDAVKAGAPVVPFSGESLARGRIPLAEGVQAPSGGGDGAGAANSPGGSSPSSGSTSGGDSSSQP